MGLIENSLLLIDQRGRQAKRDLPPSMSTANIDNSITDLKNKILMLLVIEGVRMN